MSAPLSSARLGSGGISITTQIPLDELRANLSNAKQIVAQASKEMKLQPKFDADESAILRGVKTYIRKIEAQINKEQINVRLQQFGILPSIAPGRPSIADQALPSVPLSPQQSIALSHAEYRKRQNLEAKFADELEEEEAKKKKGGGLGSIRGLLRGGIYGYAAHYAGLAIGSAASISQGVGMGMSSDPVLGAQGKLGTIQGLSSIPVIGSLFSALDKLTGTSEALNEKIKTRLALEGFGVAQAQVGGDPFSIAQKEQAKQHVDLVRERERIELAGAEAADAVSQGVGSGSIAQAIRQRTANLLADKDKEIANLNKLGGARLQFLRFDSDTRIGMNEMRVQNRGLHLQDEDALGTIRGVESGIRRATTREGKQRAVLEGLSSLRAFRSSLEVLGGGFGTSVNLATDSAGSDPFNLNPQNQARLRAIQMSDYSLGKLGAMGSPGNPALGSARARDLGLHLGGDDASSINENATDIASQGVEILGRIMDFLDGLKLTIQ